MVDFGGWIWFEKLDWRITMIWDWMFDLAWVLRFVNVVGFYGFFFSGWVFFFSGGVGECGGFFFSGGVGG